MKWFRSDFATVLAVVMLVALVNITMGFMLAFSVLPYNIASELHEVAGLMLFPILLLLPACFKSRKRLYAALRARFFITRQDWQAKRTLVILAKIVTQLFALSFIVLLITAPLIETGLLSAWLPTYSILNFHTKFIYPIAVLGIAHVVLMYLIKPRVKKTAKTSEAPAS